MNIAYYLTSFLEYSKELLNALEEGRKNDVFELLEKRELIMDTISSLEFGKEITEDPEVKKICNDVDGINKRILSSIENLKSETEIEIKKNFNFMSEQGKNKVAFNNYAKSIGISQGSVYLDRKK